MIDAGWPTPTTAPAGADTVGAPKQGQYAFTVLRMLPMDGRPWLPLIATE